MRLKSQLELICMAVICQSVKQDGKKGLLSLILPANVRSLDEADNEEK